MEKIDFESFSLLKKLEDTLKKAEIRCLAKKDILSLVPNLWENPDRELIYRRMVEFNYSQVEIKKIVSMLKVLNVEANNSKSKIRGSIDRSIMRISDILTGPVARIYFLHELEHPRKVRRRKVYKSLQQIGVEGQLVDLLISRFNDNADQEALELIARDQDAVRSTDYKFLLKNLENDYWRMRVIESLINNTTSHNVSELLDDYPWEFVYAVGRTKKKIYLKEIQKTVVQNKNNLKILGIVAWTYGQLQAISELQQIKEIYNHERSNYG